MSLRHRAYILRVVCRQTNATRDCTASAPGLCSMQTAIKHIEEILGEWKMGNLSATLRIWGKNGQDR